MKPAGRGATIELDQAAGTVTINGTDVGLVAEGGITIDTGKTRGDLLTVTLVLYPDEVRLLGLSTTPKENP